MKAVNEVGSVGGGNVGNDELRAFTKSRCNRSDTAFLSLCEKQVSHSRCAAEKTFMDAR